jgi:hypothetical protein
MEVKDHMVRVLHSYIWMPYSITAGHAQERAHRCYMVDTRLCVVHALSHRGNHIRDDAITIRRPKTHYRRCKKPQSRSHHELIPYKVHKNVCP